MGTGWLGEVLKTDLLSQIVDIQNFDNAFMQKRGGKGDIWVKCQYGKHIPATFIILFN